MALFVLIPAFASATALDQLKSFSTNARSAKGEFSQGQVKGGDKARITNLASGTFIFSRPGKFIWTYKKPYEQVLQADGVNLYIYDKDLNQVTVKNSAMHWVPALLPSFSAVTIWKKASNSETPGHMEVMNGSKPSRKQKTRHLKKSTSA